MEPSSIHDLPPATPERRSFLQWLAGGLGAVAAAVLGVPFIAYLLRTPGTPIRWVKLGPIEMFPDGETLYVTFDNPLRQPWDGMTAKTSVYVRYEEAENRFLVFAVNCAHLGCPVSWFPEAGLFMCPCHGGVYYANGDHASGPPPRGLYQCVWEVRSDGKLWIQAPHYPTLHDTLRADDKAKG
jgi:menaquinol-cytochrome c reductase iron-sulfur subunit